MACHLLLLLIPTLLPRISDSASQKASFSPQHLPLTNVTTELASENPGNASTTFEVKADLTSAIQFALGLKNLDDFPQAIENTEMSFAVDKPLQELIDIVSVLETTYGIQPRNVFAQKCANEFNTVRDSLLAEITLLQAVCKDSLEDMDADDMTNTESIKAAILQLCVNDIKNMPYKLMALFQGAYQSSYVCALEASREAVEKLQSNFDDMENTTLLLSQELHHLLNLLDKYNEDGTTIEEQSKLEKLDKDLIARFRKEVMDIASLPKSEQRRAAVERFKMDTSPAKLNISRGLEAVKNEILRIFKEYLKLDRSGVWNSSKGIQEVTWTNSRVKEMIADVLVYLPVSNPLMDLQQDLRETKLFQGPSKTLGQQCESSPFHVVGTCTRENHEICRDSRQSTSWRNPFEDEIIADDNTVFRQVFKQCNCGFRIDCTSTVHKSMSRVCFLVPDADGVCLGGVSYPCRTHPLESGKYDESCLSGFCNRQENACE